jgi:6-phosphogluconolactonase
LIAERKLFAGKRELAAALASDVAASLSTAITDRGRATMALSGGTTPKAFFQELSHIKIDWSRVTITLVDERCVPISDDRSNAKLVRENLLRLKAASAKFVQLFGGHDNPQELGPFDVVVLGMGNDGHTASFFPGGDNLSEALDIITKKHIVTMTAPGVPEKRLTFTLPILLDSNFVVLHIEGEDKKKTLADAEKPGPIKDMPIRAFLRAREPIILYWCP